MKNILVTIDANYLLPLEIMIYSLFKNNPKEKFCVFLLYSDIAPKEIEFLKQYIESFSQSFTPLPISSDALSHAPVNSYYSKAMYYRLLACELLPSEIDRILYLDPDILIINPIASLYDTNLSTNLWGACAHNSPIVDSINKVRLQAPELSRYFNSGVLLMNLARQRKEIRSEDIFNYVEKNQNILLLPDQDVLNGLYGDKILALDDSLYNFDVRKKRNYLLSSIGEKNLDWITTNTVVLHFCGKQKPWNTKYHNRFGLLYKHYMNLVRLYIESELDLNSKYH